jgi:spoIIIJ-associated protein
MEEQLSEVLDNLLGMLLLEGSYEIEQEDEGFLVSIDTKDAGRLIGARGESLEGLQLIVNQIMSRKSTDENFQRVILDVSGWRKQKEEDLKAMALSLGKQVLETGKEMDLEPMSSWQRRVVHMTLEGMGGVSSESAGEGRDRHIVIKPLSSTDEKPQEQSVESNKD